MITIYAEKPDVGNKIAAALDKITLSTGKIITFKDLKANEKAVKSQQFKDGYLKIKYLGEDCYVTWGYGHLCELKDASDYDPEYKNWSKMPMPFIPSSYDVKVKDDVKKQFKLVADLMKKSSLIINATDYDREGELIFAYMYDAAKLKVPFKRAHFSSQTEEGLKEGFAKLLTSAEVKNITDAGRGRSIADAVVGWNMTAKMTLKNGSRDVLSIGRVQTPTLNILVERELAIRNFKPEPYYTINAVFKTDKGEEYKAEHKEKKFKDEETAQKVFDKINGQTGTVFNVEKKSTKKEAPNLHSLSSLQMAANTKYGFTMAKTLKVAQELYEGGYTTYPRTDSQFLTEDMVDVVNETMAVLEAGSTEYAKLISGKGKVVKTKKYFDDKKVQSHFAIIPTKNFPSGLTSDQEKLYDIIARSMIMMLYKEAIIENTKILTIVKSEEFISNGKVVKDPQWMLVDTTTKEELLPDVKIGDKVKGTYKLNKKMTEPPKRFTDKTLLNAMLNAGKELDDDELKKVMENTDAKGIGTEATRASIVETLINRQYAKRDKKSIYATDKGIQLITILPIKEIKSAELTALWEKRLDEIAKGNDNLNLFVKDIENLTRKWVNELEENITGSMNVNNIGVCPLCSGDVRKLSWGYGCANYNSGCKFSVSSEIAKKKITDDMVKEILENRETGIIKGFTSKAGKKFDAKLAIGEDGKVGFKFEDAGNSSQEPTESDFICPNCGCNLMNERWAYKCSCGLSISKSIASRDLSEKEIETLLNEGKTGVLKGFTSKAGKKFDAALKLEDGKVSFDFDTAASDNTTDFTCPICGGDITTDKWNYKCDCGLKISKSIASKEIPESQIAKLINTGKTDKISGFTSKAGKKFDAVLKLEDGKISFDFS